MLKERICFDNSTAANEIYKSTIVYETIDDYSGKIERPTELNYRSKLPLKYLSSYILSPTVPIQI